MKQGIHPEYMECTIRCTCGNTWTTHDTVPELTVELCNACHPFYTGQQKFVDTGGRVQRFSDKFGGAAAALQKEKEAKAARAAKAAEVEAAAKAEREKKAAEKAKRAAEFAAKAEAAPAPACGAADPVAEENAAE